MTRTSSDRQPLENEARPRLRRGWAAVVLSFGLGITVYALWLRHQSEPRHPNWALLPILAVAIWVAQGQAIQVRSRRLSLSFSVIELPVAVSIVFLPAPAAIAVSSVVFLAYVLRGRRSLFKAFCGVSGFFVALNLAVYSYDTLVARSSAASLLGWLSIATATLVLIVVDISMVLVMMWITDPRWRRPPLRPFLLQQAIAVGVCSAGAIVAVSILFISTWGVLLVGGILVGASLGYRATVTSRQRFANLEKLYEFTRRLSSITEARDVMITVLEEARTLLSASRAEVVIPLSGFAHDAVLRCTLADDDPPLFEEGVALPALSRLVGERGSVLLARGSQDGEVKRLLRDHGVREALVAPLQQEDLMAGYLLVADRPYKHDGFTDSDLLFFETLAANAGVALRSSELLEKLRREAVVRHHQAHHDRLTGLPNRLSFNERLQATLDSSGKDANVAVLLADLDGFKEVNDTLGHHTGDRILLEVARRLEPLASDHCMVARMGGDEFAVLLEGDPRDEAVAAAASEVLSMITQPMAVDDLSLDVRASLGVAIAPPQGRGRDAVSLVRRADVAMYAAKESGGGTRFYDPSQDRSTLRSLTLATELRRTLEREELQVFYQPVVHLGTGEVLGCEALLRWDHREFGSISPVEFIPVAENAGLIDPLTWWVLEKALAQVKQWHDLVPKLSVSVNLSARSLTNRKVSDRVVAALEKAGLDSSSLTLELTESSMMADPTVSQQAMQDLKDLGVKLSIDDYGTGFSSLSRLKDLPFRELKIDRSFVKEMIHDQGDEAIVRSTIELARNLGRTVTAEGVEDKATMQRLASLGCTAAQGYYLARPLSAGDFTTWLRSFVRWPSTVAQAQGAPDLAVAGPGENGSGNGSAAGKHADAAPAARPAEGGQDSGQGSTAWQLNS